MDIKYRIVSALKYLVKAHYRRGHHIHSPYCYHVATDVLFEKHPYYSYSEIEAARSRMLACHDALRLDALGTSPAMVTTVSKEQRRSQKSPALGQLLQRLCRECSAQTIVELGTNTGITTLYLSANDSKSRVYTFEGQHELVRVARSNFKKLNRKNITIVEGNINAKFPAFIEKINTIDLLFVDANHRYEPTMHYFNLAKTRAGKNSIFVFDDINWSQAMHRAWEEICNDPDVTLSIDIYSMGIVWFNPDLPKQQYIIAF